MELYAPNAWVLHITYVPCKIIYNITSLLCYLTLRVYNTQELANMSENIEIVGIWFIYENSKIKILV